MEALSLGASDFVTKPDGSSEGNPQDKIKALLLPTLKALFANHFTVSKQEVPTLKPSGSYPAILWDLMKPQIVVIGSSTGGPNALEKIFSQIHGPLNCPIVIAQHMPPIFTATLIERLGKISGIPASEAKDGDELEKNHLYIAPGNYHLRLKSTLGKVTLHLDQGEQINFVRPAVDPLFDTAASIFKDRCLGIVLTGMGSDGKVGAEIIKSRGGAMMIQEPKSCVVFGMPGAVHASGAYDRMGTLEEIASVLQEKVCIGTIQGKKYV
jgi:two-component system chemotaxis response regulator CheB